MQQQVPFGAVGLAGAACAVAVSWWAGDVEPGLDFRGGARASVRAVDPARIDRVIERLALDVDVDEAGDQVTFSADEPGALAPVRALASAAPFAASAGGEEVFTDADLVAVSAVDAGSFGGAVRVELGPEGAEALARVPAGLPVVLALGDETVASPTLREPITDGVLLLTLPGKALVDARALADRLAAAGPPTPVDWVEVHSAFPEWLGVPAARALAAGVAASALVAGQVGRRSAVAVAAAGVGVIAALGVASTAAGVLSSSAWAGACLGALGGVVVWLGGDRGSAAARSRA
ncbi:MAG: hypothetical protein ABMA64_22570, partial [Myxococcota bacterium]